MAAPMETVDTILDEGILSGYTEGGAEDSGLLRIV